MRKGAAVVSAQLTGRLMEPAGRAWPLCHCLIWMCSALARQCPQSVTGIKRHALTVSMTSGQSCLVSDLSKWRRKVAVEGYTPLYLEKDRLL